MKKKLLSLVLAGAMVASTSVSAFAAGNEKNYEIGEGGQEHKVTITGDVQDNKGGVVAGTISVTVPTAVSFTIDKDGKIAAGNIEIVNRNNNQDKVEVVVKQFDDPKSTTGIVLVKDADLDSQSDTTSTVHASLKLEGDDDSVELVSSKTTSPTGLIDKTGQPVNLGTDTSLGKAWNGSNLTLKLTGRTKTGYQAPTQGNAIRNEFNLLLKIQKAS